MLAKRRSLAMRLLLEQIFLYKCLKQTKTAISDEKENRKFKMQCARVALLLFIRLGKPMRKHGGYDYCMINKIRDCFSFTTWFMKP